MAKLNENEHGMWHKESDGTKRALMEIQFIKEIGTEH